MALVRSDLAKLSSLLDEALELKPADVEPWLGALPAEYQHLAPRLREMLAQHHANAHKGFMADGPRLAGEPTAEKTIARPGEGVGPYRLLRELGRGGMGAVWLAERADGGLKRQVAVKIPRLAWGPGLAERMARERDIGALLAHPNIARLYDAGVDSIGRPYLALEYIEGVPLDEWCHARQLGVEARLRLFLQVARAVAYAHGRLVVHRDLKPSNILVTADGQAHLLDFGIAKLLGDAGSDGPTLTQALGRVLTPHYASPEQLKGEPITVASDVYSLGVLLYFLLTQCHPYEMEYKSIEALERAMHAASPPLASTRVFDASLAKALRGELDAIMDKALHRAAPDRYPTADALADDVERHLAGERVLAMPDSIGYRLGKAVRRHRAVVATVGAVLLAVLGAAGASIVQVRHAHAEAQLAHADAAQARLALAEALLGQSKRAGALRALAEAEAELLAAGEQRAALAKRVASLRASANAEPTAGPRSAERSAEKIAQPSPEKGTEQTTARADLPLAPAPPDAAASAQRVPAAPQ